MREILTEKFIFGFNHHHCVFVDVVTHQQCGFVDVVTVHKNFHPFRLGCDWLLNRDQS
jgi:hypothetical protein